MPKKNSDKDKGWKRLSVFARTHTSLLIIIAAALLLELTTGVMYYAAQNIIMWTVERLLEREMHAISLSVRNHLAKVEITLDNLAWVETDNMEKPDSLFSATRRLVKHNPAIYGSSITCVPNLFPERGYWFEPYSVRRPDGTIETMQLGSASHDYTKQAFFTEPIARGTGCWCEPYLDSDGARAIVTSYGVPIRNNRGETVAVIDADLSLDWLGAIMNEGKLYKSSQRFLVTGQQHILAGEDSVLCRKLMDRKETDDSLGYYTMEEKGRMKHVFSMPVGGKTDWQLICVLDDGEVFGGLRQVRLFLLLLILAGVLLAGFIVWRSSRNLNRLRKIREEKERISQELHVASKIQQSMLPPGHLKQEQVEIAGSLVPAREVGGDLFDYFVRDDKLYFCIGDVSGKGTPSAMLMASTRSLFRAFSTNKNNPAHIMEAINEPSCNGNETNMFVTMFIGILDLPTGHLRYCNAGHDCPIVLKDEVRDLPCHANLPIGVFDDMKYSVQDTYLEADDMLFLYTDGLTEAKRGNNSLFGLERIKEVLSRFTDNRQAPLKLMQLMNDEVHRFVGDNEQSDDLTMLAIRYTPKPFEDILCETLTLKNDISEVSKLSSFQKALFEQMKLEQSLARQLRLAIEEAVVNVLSYAYDEGTEGDVEIRMMSDGHQLKVMIIDAGIPFDPTEQEKIDTSTAVEDRRVGGLGIHLVRELMDTVNYERIDGKNILTLMKQI